MIQVPVSDPDLPVGDKKPVAPSSLKRGVFAAGMVFCVLLAISALDSLLMGFEGKDLVVLLACGAGAVTSTLVCLRFFYGRYSRIVIIAFAALALTVGALDSVCGAISHISSPRLSPPSDERHSRAQLLSWVRAHPGVEFLRDDDQVSVIGRRRGWAKRWLAVVPTDSCRELQPADRALLGLAPGAPCDEVARQLSARWPEHVFTVYVWRPDKLWPAEFEFDEDNRMGPLGVYPSEVLVRDLRSWNSLKDRWRSYRNLVVFTFSSPHYRPAPPR